METNNKQLIEKINDLMLFIENYEKTTEEKKCLDVLENELKKSVNILSKTDNKILEPKIKIPIKINHLDPINSCKKTKIKLELKNKILIKRDLSTLENCTTVLFKKHYSTQIDNKLKKISIKDCGKGEIILAKRIDECDNQIFAIEKTSRNTKTRLQEWGDRTEIFSINTRGVDILEKVLHMFFHMYRIKRISKKDGHNEVEWFDFSEEYKLSKNGIKNSDILIDIIKKLGIIIDNKIMKLSKNITKVNLNTATKNELKELPSISNILAERIVEYRQTLQYETKKDIMNISGIKQGKYNKIEDLICV